MVKAGFSGEDSPRCVFSSIIGKPRHQMAMCVRISRLQQLILNVCLTTGILGAFLVWFSCVIVDVLAASWIGSSLLA